LYHCQSISFHEIAQAVAPIHHKTTHAHTTDIHHVRGAANILATTAAHIETTIFHQLIIIS
jgi:hypothetical protein